MSVAAPTASPAAFSAAGNIYSQPYTCLSGQLIGDPVYLSGVDTVAKCDPTNSAKMPCIGIVVSKPTTTTCIVQLQGEFPGWTGLTADALHYVGTGGAVSATAGTISQVVGYARDTTTLVITIATETLPVAVVQALTANGQTITLPSGTNRKLVSSSGTLTGIILTAGSYDGQEITLILEGASNTAVFAASGTSNVAAGAADNGLLPDTAARFIWVAANALWYHQV